MVFPEELIINFHTIDTVFSQIGFTKIVKHIVGFICFVLEI